MTRKKKTPTAPAPLPPAVHVAVYPPKETESEEMCTLANKCLAGGTANPTTIGTSPFLAPMSAAVAAVTLEIPLANAGSVVAKSNLLAGTRKLHGTIMAHAGWVDSNMLGMAPADAAAYAVAAGLTTAKSGAHPAILEMGVENGPVGSLLLIAEFPNTEGRCLSCTEFSIDGEKTWTRGPDTERSRVNLPLLFTVGQSVVVRLRMFLRGTGYTPWSVFTMTVA
jgi:hypothetical protein